MEYVSEEHCKLLLNKEWLVKIDSEKSIPYLMKFYSSTVDLTCCILITDTQHVWGEILSSKQFARRWHDCNPRDLSLPITMEEEDGWRIDALNVLSSFHTLGGILDSTFELVESHNADLAFELGSEELKWRWETYALGPKASAEVLSKHLIMPLISVSHLAFSSADPVSELSEVDLEKAVDKMGRTARRTVDTHIKHAISRPRVATTLRRMTAMFNFFPDLPAIVSDAAKPDLILPSARPKPRAASKNLDSFGPSPPHPSAHIEAQSPSAARSTERQRSAELVPGNMKAGTSADDESVTESDDDDHPIASSKGTQKQYDTPGSRSPPRSGSQTRVSLESYYPHPLEKGSTPDRMPAQGPAADDSSLPAKRTKRAVVASSEDEDSEAERRRRVVQLKSGAHRGTKQPFKRGGRRF